MNTVYKCYNEKCNSEGVQCAQISQRPFAVVYNNLCIFGFEGARWKEDRLAVKDAPAKREEPATGGTNKVVNHDSPALPSSGVGIDEAVQRKLDGIADY